MSRRKLKKGWNEHPSLFDDGFFGTEDSSGDFEVKLTAEAPAEPEETADAADDSDDDAIAPNDAELTEPALEPLRFISFGSGSSGNCAYLGTQSEGILIDAGVIPDNVFPVLQSYGIKPEQIKGILLSHDHGDHVRYAYTLIRKHRDLHVYCTPKTLNGIFRRHNTPRRLKDYHVAFYKEIPFKVAGFTVTAFNVSHDGTDNCGFFIERGGQSFAIATDLGCITERVRYYMRQANFAMIESNYDRRMLDTGHYPEYLKNRIRSESGHLDNRVSADFMAGLYGPQLRYIFLCHLSHDNNTPELALEAYDKAFAEKGITLGHGDNDAASIASPVQVVALPRFDASDFFSLRK